MDVIKLLTDDHSEVDELFRRFQIADKADTKGELARQIVHDLSVHAAIEEQFVYPLVRLKADGGGDIADHSIEEHAEVKRLLADLEKAEAGTKAHDDLMMQVIESVRHHVEEEEGELFPKLRDATGEGVRDKVGAVAEQAKKVVPTHPHPLVPGTATAQLVAGPWAAMVDKVRDVFG